MIHETAKVGLFCIITSIILYYRFILELYTLIHIYRLFEIMM